ncbi:carbohydrate sulfotransferase 11-like isoform X2 [Homarus americanus]|uniref:carbohydrate sulfotransferase 11-like isoform X2 n=1 Tax=Homarus americanus TaxID=6706 RepID=UPI001C43E36A|nr:carbohydrate sulfotransferase 11-like isoform X2 [Homarus americanus]
MRCVRRQVVLVQVGLLALFVFLAQLIRPDQSSFGPSSSGPKERSEELRRRVKEICSVFNVSSEISPLQLQHIYVDDTRRLLYCSAQKVASSAWKKVWLRLTNPSFNVSGIMSNRLNIHLKTQEYMLIQPKFEDVWPDMLASYRKFLFIRHPFHRVVSAYRDKMEVITEVEDLGISHFMKKKISEKFGSSTDPEGVVKFEEFVRFISHQEEYEDIPWDGHWLPVHQICNPCGIQYDFIGKFEQLDQDSSYIFKWLEVEEEMGQFPVPMKTTAASSLASTYLHKLNSTLRRAFVSRYILDYLSFNYDFV